VEVAYGSQPKRSRKGPPIAGSLAVSGKTAGSKDCVVGPGGLEPALTVGLRAHCTRGRGRAPRPIQWGTDRWGVADLGLVLVAQRRGLHPLHGRRSGHDGQSTANGSG
jgi:hypothetical protein